MSTWLIGGPQAAASQRPDLWSSRRIWACIIRTRTVIFQPSEPGRSPPGTVDSNMKRAVSLSRRLARLVSRPENTSGLLPTGEE